MIRTFYRYYSHSLIVPYSIVYNLIIHSDFGMSTLFTLGHNVCVFCGSAFYEIGKKDAEQDQGCADDLVGSDGFRKEDPSPHDRREGIEDGEHSGAK